MRWAASVCRIWPRVALQAIDLMQDGFALKGDGIRTIFEAFDAEVGRDARCVEDGDGSG